jgi:glutathione S-transferase
MKGTRAMKLYSAPYPAPNPLRVLIFLAEKGMSIPVVDLSIVKAEQKAPDFVVKNSRGQVPVLELADGTCIAESVAICRYLDDIGEGPSLFGETALERAMVEMWVRRIEFNVMQPVGLFWAHAHPFTARVVTQFKDFGHSNRARFEAAALWLDGELAKSAFVAGEAFTIADIVAYSTLDFANWIGLPLPEEATALLTWHKTMKARPSIAALMPTPTG